MTNEDAKSWIRAKFDVSRETFAKLERYEALVLEGQALQNLVSATTLPNFWSRHIVDSAQLALLAPIGIWLDIGSGAGAPGIITAILTGAPTMLVESRPRRAQFLQETTAALGLSNVSVFCSTVQKLVVSPVDVITARAVAALPALLAMAHGHSHKDTVWILPKGKTAQTELASLPDTWQGDWQLHNSVTDPDSQILVGRHIRTKIKR